MNEHLVKIGTNNLLMKSKENKFEEIFEVVKLIPKGRVSTYGNIAAYLGAKSGARMVGWAMNAAHTNPEIPAHRVVNRLGMLSGKMHFQTPTTMQELLHAEGVKVIDDKIENFSKVLWVPSEELL